MLSPRDAAFIACRIIAVFHITQWASGILWGFKEIIGLIARSITYGPLELSQSFVNIVPVAVVHLVIVFFLWFGADMLAGWVCPRREEETVANDWDRKNAFAFVVAGVGLLILLLKLPVLLQWAYLLNDREGADYWLDTQMFTMFVSVFIGLICIMGAGTIARAVGYLRRW